MATLAGKEAALFCSSGTLSNQLAIRTHLLQPPYSVLCDKRAHVNCYEAGGIAFHCGAAVITCIPKAPATHLTVDVVKKEIVLDDDIHHARTQLICLENTMNGEIFPLDEQRKISELARQTPGLAIHLDGARLWNAMVATGSTLKEMCDPYDSVSLCFSKGLGAPVGSVLVGSAKFIRKARHFRKLYGGGMRQAGLLAEACLFCLQHHLPNLHKDHENAAFLARSLQDLGLVLTKKCETNMVWVDFASFDLTADEVSAALAAKGIKIFSGSESEIRLVLHHQISRQAVVETISTIKQLLKNRKLKGKL